MALYITYEGGSEEGPFNVEGLISLAGLTQFEGLAAGYKVASIQADGNELQHILTNFEGIPYPLHKRVVQWFGDTAQFIIANW